MGAGNDPYNRGQGTTLIIGDRVLYRIDESKLKDTKVRVLPG